MLKVIMCTKANNKLSELVNYLVRIMIESCCVHERRIVKMFRWILYTYHHHIIQQHLLQSKYNKYSNEIINFIHISRAHCVCSGKHINVNK
jgi:hypothetical protein